MIQLFDKSSNADIGVISETQLQFLIDQLEEEFIEDRDYAITAMTVAYLQGQGADPGLIDLLNTALGEQAELLIAWKRA